MNDHINMKRGSLTSCLIIIVSYCGLNLLYITQTSNYLFESEFPEATTQEKFSLDSSRGWKNDSSQVTTENNGLLIDTYSENLTATRSYKIDQSLIVTRALGEPLLSSQESAQSKKSKIKLSIVISHCENPVDWITKYIGENKFDVTEITIISKCGKKVDGVDSLKKLGGIIKIQRLSNVGRCDHSYAHWIHTNYAQLQEQSPDDLIFFVKDNDYMSEHFRPFEDVVFTTSDVGFGCVMRPRCVVWRKKICQRHGALALHNKSTVERVSMSQYDRTEREKMIRKDV